MSAVLFRRGPREALRYDDEELDEAPPARLRRDLPALAKHEDDFGTLELLKPKRQIEKPIVELVDGILPEFGVGFIGGASGALKTFGIMDWLATISTGGSIAGREVMRPGGVIYIAFEGKDTVEARHVGLCIDRGREMDRAPFYVIRDAKPIHDDHTKRHAPRP